VSLDNVIASLAPDAEPARATLLGEGVWGSTYDLADGTVVKLIRQFAGLGDAVELWRNETRALEALNDLALPCPVPRLVASATTEPDSAAGRAGWLAWIRMTRLIGEPLDDDKVVELAPAARSRLAHGLGETLAALHEAELAETFADSRANVDAGYLDEIAPLLTDVADERLMTALRAALDDMATSPDTVANHGDVNTTNILADTEGRLTGLIDWAEARRDWAEAEFCHLRLIPEFFAPVRAAYEARRGVRLNDRRLDLVALHNALITVAIARRRGDKEEETWGLEWVETLRGAARRAG
jgi:aminoglycoside phosphotransferase (APT) family kinase protein